MPIRSRHRLPDSRVAALIELRGDAGRRVLLTDLGATLMRIDVPDRGGRLANILLGHDDPAAYPAAGGPGRDAFMGASCGRVANRVGGAAFALDGRVHRLAANEGRNQLHGGPVGFHHGLWTVVEAGEAHALLRHVSPHGDQGYPGTLTATARFTLAGDVLTLRYEAETDAATHVNLVSHPYFNLTGDPASSIQSHRLRIDADAFLPIDAESLPTGERRPVDRTPFDFRRPRTVGAAINGDDPQLVRAGGYDHALILNGTGMRPVAWLEEPVSGRTVEIATDQPALQLYSGNALSHPRRPRTGLCLETQAWPDSPNRPDFLSTRLEPGARYVSETRFRFGADAS